jgi:hypothetical protein
MSQLNFFTPVHYGSFANTSEKKAIQVIDDYFYVSGQKAVVIGKIDERTEQVVYCKSTL